VGPEGLIVVSTHVAGLDPVAIQTLMPHWIRWMMSAEMMLPVLVPLWRLQIGQRYTNADGQRTNRRIPKH
jgi:hypothetical protein